MTKKDMCEVKCPELKKEVDKFISDVKNGTCDIETELQRLGTELLTQYEIRVKDIKIEPLRVEPYLFVDENDNYKDKFIHHIKDKDNILWGKKQRDRFEELYIHPGNGGVDIVLSDCDDYAFSFLIKNSKITIGTEEPEYVKQIDLAKN